MNNKAILISANLKANYAPGTENVGNILAHASHIEKAGAALWGIAISGDKSKSFTHFPHPEIKKGYFYSVADKAVTHVIDIEFIKTANEIETAKLKREISGYLIESRKGYWKDGSDSFFWMKMLNIYKLKKSHALQDFNLYSTNESIRNCRNYAIVNDPEYKHHNRLITRREIMHDYIADLLLTGTVTEKDIEELFAYRLSDNLELVDRQGSFERGGRLDLLYKKSNKYTVFELKKSVAELPALSQIKGYMQEVQKKYKIDSANIKGVILSKSIDPALARALTKETNITAKTYYFSIDMK